MQTVIVLLELSYAQLSNCNYIEVVHNYVCCSYIYYNGWLFNFCTYKLKLRLVIESTVAYQVALYKPVGCSTTTEEQKIENLHKSFQWRLNRFQPPQA